jgi:methionyl-tRNA formyltransferase
MGTSQDPAQVTKAPRLKKQHGVVDWTRSAGQIHNQIRALKPWPGTFTFWKRPNGESLRLVLDEASVVPLNSQSPCNAGQVVVSDGKQLVVATGSGGLSIMAIAPAGKRHMRVEEFLRGYRIREGDILGGGA